jgi:hypothetical protein
MGPLNVTKVVTTIDHVFSERAGGQNQSLRPWARPGITSLAKSQAATGAHSTGSADLEGESIAERWTSPIDDELLSTLAASRR